MVATAQFASRFRLTRPPSISAGGLVSNVDETIHRQLFELNAVLARHIFDESVLGSPTGSVVDAHKGNAGDPQDSKSSGDKDDSPAAFVGFPLKPKNLNKDDWTWPPTSLVAKFLAVQPDVAKLNLSAYIDATPELSDLKYAFDDRIEADTVLGFNVKAVLSEAYPAIRDYLVVYGYLTRGLRDAAALRNFVVSSSKGAANVADYAIVSAARSIVRSKALVLPAIYDDSGKDGVVADIQNKKLSLSSVSFEPALRTILDDHIFNSEQTKLINESKIKPIPDEMKPKLVKYIKASPIPITKANIDFFLPMFISQINGNTGVEPATPVTPEESESDFEVRFFEDDQATAQVSRAAVKCAAQLYYGMVVGDELDVFDVVNYFTHKYLIRGGMEVVDRRLRDDLQTYVFSDRFVPDLKTRRICDRTRPAERQMFYRQVFGIGRGPEGGDMIVNRDFTKQWNIMILESAQYLERAQASFHPDSFVSRQKVMQAVEDLQYNLSAHCTGMANVITPLIYAELNFIIERIFMHPEVLRHVVPERPTWWRVVEQLSAEMRHSRPKATVLYNRAKLGHDIISSIAKYNPATFQDDVEFSAFISNVDAFITTQSILQDTLTDDLRRDSEDVEEREHDGLGDYEPVPAASASNGKPPTDEWDF
jgi:hypothetical protein